MHRFLGTLALVAGIVALPWATTFAAVLTYSSLPVPTPETRATDVTAANAAQSAISRHVELLWDRNVRRDDRPTIGSDGHARPDVSHSGITGVATFSGVFDVPGGLPFSNPNALVEQPATAGQPAYQNNITFSTPVTAFGTYICQAGDVAADTITLQLDNTITGSSQDVLVGTAGPNAIFNTVFYFGLTDSSPFNRVTLLLSNSSDGVLLDNTTVGTAVPEPSSMLLLCDAGRRAVPDRLRPSCESATYGLGCRSSPQEISAIRSMRHESDRAGCRSDHREI